MKAYKNKENLIIFLRSKKTHKVKIWNRWRVYLYSKNILSLDLSNADLSNADLRNADLTYANLENADLRSADLTYANLRNANLNNANLDFSCLFLSCKSLKANFDDKQLIQILYHFAKPALNSNNCKDKDIKKLLKLKLFSKVVNKFHRVDECGKI